MGATGAFSPSGPSGGASPGALSEAPSDQPLPEGDVYCLGGGEDDPQVRAARALEDDGGLRRAVHDGAVVLAVCAGYQILGRSFPAADGTLRTGLGLLDAWTIKGSRRAVGKCCRTQARARTCPRVGRHSSSSPVSRTTRG